MPEQRCVTGGQRTSAGPGADAPAARAPQDPLRTSDGKKLVALGAPFMRDVPYSWNTMVDNLCARHAHTHTLDYPHPY
jgi:phenylpropionate dioxygenase-like ring-hydroxylating dioxygenase large terminal subunit